MLRAVLSRSLRWVVTLSLAVSAPLSVYGATLPAHEPLSVLIVADAVNPNRLAPEDLTEPEDFAPALQADDSGLSIASVVTVDSQCVDEALTALEGASRPSVVLYFAHRAAKTCGGGDGQTRLVAGFEAGLTAGMGIVVFHHGLYGDLYTPGAKDSVLQLVGAESSGIAWDTTTGQRVFIVGGDHFVASNGITAEGEADLGAVDGVTAGNYPYFDNIPDERYPTTTLNIEPGEERVPLFATNSGGERLVGYALTRPGWQGRVVAYQPGEFQPHALDDRAGNNFQILANALYYSALGAPGASTEPAPSTSASEANTPPDTSGTGSAVETELSTDNDDDDTGALVPPGGVTPTPGGTSGGVPPSPGVSPAPVTPSPATPSPVAPGAVPPAPSGGVTPSTASPTHTTDPATPSALPTNSDTAAPAQSDSGCSFAEPRGKHRGRFSWSVGLALSALLLARARQRATPRN